ncbi:hypothetical protein GGI01_002244 [Coemansia sp. RSA 376]|nr:hypothetical protein GGI01_002244 [Coemansia sp. RSA 376]
MGSNHGQQRALPDDTPRHSTLDSSTPMAGATRLVADPPQEWPQKTEAQPTAVPLPAYTGRVQQQHPSAGLTSVMPGAHGVHHPHHQPHPQQAIPMGMLPPPRRPPITTQPHNMHSAAASSSSHILRPHAPHSPHTQHTQHRHSHSHSHSHMHRIQQQQQQPAHHRPYDVHSPAPASRTFWNHYETGLLVQLWLELEPQFVANKRNAGVWAQLAQRLTEQSARHRTDLVNALHMSHDAKLREFPYFSDFLGIRQRSSLLVPQQSTTQHQETSEGKATPSDDGQYFPRAASHPYSPSAVAGPAPAYSPPAPHLAADNRWAHQGMAQASPVISQSPHQASLASILSSSSSSNTRPYPVSAPTLQHLLSPAPVEEMPRSSSSQPSPAVYAQAPHPGSAQHPQREPSIRDIAGLLHQLDQASDNYDDYDDVDDEDIDSDSIDKMSGVESMIGRMRALASESSAADVSSAVYHIMSYVERESRRRHVQSERHHRVVAALADILAQSTASSTAAPSAAASRRSSGVERGWSPQQMSRHGLLLQNAAPRPPSCDSTPTDSPPHTHTPR